jgi:hypothetical protein
VTRTRAALHAVGESVIAGPQYRADGTIRLALRPEGFAGAVLPVAVEGTELVWPGGRMPIDGATCAELGRAAGLEAGPPAGLYHDGAAVALDERLRVDGAEAAALVAWYALGDVALRALGAPGEPVLWPEHFDLAVTVGDAAVGVSPGDGYSPEPYAYVSVERPPRGALWNAPFGASLAAAAVSQPSDLEAFFRRALAESAELAGGRSGSEGTPRRRG